MELAGNIDVEEWESAEREDERDDDDEDED
jgi:hypothetical protein